ncbi:MAG: RNA-binding protein [Acidobacteria bacterium]|nr:RNA-binding protein [Acidobacteriota bacterium]MBI3656629.1 RNA-binding protein [Acidobacteriota bacterium]
MSNVKLYVGNLSFETSQTDLEELFAQHAGAIEDVKIIRDLDSGRSRGFAFVEVGSPEEAQKAITALNGFTLKDRALVVNEARPKTEKPRGGKRDYQNRGGGGRDRW